MGDTLSCHVGCIQSSKQKEDVSKCCCGFHVIASGKKRCCLLFNLSEGSGHQRTLDAQLTNQGAAQN